MKKLKTLPKQLYLVWHSDNPSDIEYFAQYDSLEDAVSAEGDNCKVYVADIKYLGRFRRSVKIIKSKKENK